MIRAARPSNRPASRVISRESTQLRVVQQSRVRLLFAAVFFTLSFSAIALRLMEVSVLEASHVPFASLVAQPTLYDEQVERHPKQVQQVLRDVRRRDIVDRAGNVLATSITTASLVANPKLIRSPEATAKQLKAALPSESQAALLTRLKRSDTSFIYLKRHLSPAEQQRVNALGVPGLFFEPDHKRIYPYGELFAHVLGYVDVDNSGLSGIERSFNDTLHDERAAGKPLALSLDLKVQSVLREEMKKAVTDFRAIGATGVVMDIKSGEILALSNLPEFDPNLPGQASSDARFNRASLGVYEMGSTFKTFTVAMALEKGVVGMDGGFDASSPIKVGGYTISDYHPKARWLSVPEIYVYSSNIGTVKMAMEVGASGQQGFLRKLGLFDEVGIEIKERGKPQIPSPWRDISAMTISYGHGMSVTPLHMVRATATVLGGGRQANLTLLKDGNSGKQPGEAVLSEDTSRAMRRLMRLVVQYGTATQADAPGFRVGGKTGTAEKINASGTYSQDAKIASFIGAFPMDNPRYLILVMVDEPKGNASTYGYATGGWVAAPVAGRVVGRLGPMLGVRPVFEAPNPDEVQWWAASERGNPSVLLKEANYEKPYAVTY